MGKILIKEILQTLLVLAMAVLVIYVVNRFILNDDQFFHKTPPHPPRLEIPDGIDLQDELEHLEKPPAELDIK